MPPEEIQEVVWTIYLEYPIVFISGEKNITIDFIIE